MAAGKIDRIVAPLETTHHQPSFERTHDQRGQFRGIDVGTNLPCSLPILGNRLETTEPRTESPPSFRSQVRIAIVGIDGRVQQGASPWHQPGAPVPKVPDEQLQALNGVRDLLSSLETRIQGDLPGVVEG